MKIFSNLDKYYLKNTDTTISYSGFKIFKENCFLHQAPRVISLILSLLNKEREGEEIPTYLVIQALKVVLKCRFKFVLVYLSVGMWKELEYTN